MDGWREAASIREKNKRRNFLLKEAKGGKMRSLVVESESGDGEMSHGYRPSCGRAAVLLQHL